MTCWPWNHIFLRCVRADEVEIWGSKKARNAGRVRRVQAASRHCPWQRPCSYSGQMNAVWAISWTCIHHLVSSSILTFHCFYSLWTSKNTNWPYCRLYCVNVVGTGNVLWRLLCVSLRLEMSLRLLLYLMPGQTASRAVARISSCDVLKSKPNQISIYFHLPCS